MGRKRFGPVPFYPGQPFTLIGRSLRLPAAPGAAPLTVSLPGPPLPAGAVRSVTVVNEAGDGSRTRAHTQVTGTATPVGRPAPVEMTTHRRVGQPSTQRDRRRHLHDAVRACPAPGRPQPEVGSRSPPRQPPTGAVPCSPHAAGEQPPTLPQAGRTLGVRAIAPLSSCDDEARPPVSGFGRPPPGLICQCPPNAVRLGPSGLVWHVDRFRRVRRCHWRWDGRR